MVTRRCTRGRSRGLRQAAFTLAEVFVSIGVAAASIGGIIAGYVLVAHRAEWSAASGAAQAMAARRLEEVRAARWDSWANPVVDELPLMDLSDQVQPLDMPQTRVPLYGTNKVTVVMVQPDPPLRLIRVDCIWSLPNRGPFTNSVFTYRAPDQ
jgi:hypothetical protein